MYVCACMYGGAGTGFWCDIRVSYNRLSMLILNPVIQETVQEMNCMCR